MVRTTKLSPNVILADIVFNAWSLKTPLSTKHIDWKTDEARSNKPISIAFTEAGEVTTPIATGLRTAYRHDYQIDVIVSVSVPRSDKRGVSKAKDNRWTLLKEVENIVGRYKDDIARHDKEWAADFRLGREVFPPADNRAEGVYSITRRVECVATV